MLTTGLRSSLSGTVAASDALRATCRERQHGWRGDVVRLRRVIAGEMGRMAALAAEIEPQSETIRALRHALSNLRFAVAELQASWPAVSLDPGSPAYRDAVKRVVASLEKVDGALSAFERDSRSGAARPASAIA